MPEIFRISLILRAENVFNARTNSNKPCCFLFGMCAGVDVVGIAVVIVDGLVETGLKPVSTDNADDTDNANNTNDTDDTDDADITSLLSTIIMPCI